MGHIGHLLAAQQMLQQLHAHPDRQHDQGRPARVVEVEQQHVEEADAPHAVHHRIHGHEGRNRTRCPQAVTAHAGIEHQREQRGADAADHVEGQIGEGPQSQLQGEAEQEQKHHIAQQMAGAAMQKDGGEGLQGLPAGAILIAHGPALGKAAARLVGREGGTCSLPLRMAWVAGGDDLAVQQALAEFLLLPQQRIELGIGLVLIELSHGLQRVLVKTLAALGGLLLKIGQERWQLQRWQSGLGILPGRFFHGMFLGRLPAPEDHAVDDDEQHRHPGRGAPGRLVLKRNRNKHGGLVRGSGSASCSWALVVAACYKCIRDMLRPAPVLRDEKKPAWRPMLAF